MNRFNEKPANTDLYSRIRLTPMNAIQREVALNALREADSISDAIMWIVNGVRHLSERIFAKPAGLKHSH